MYDFHYNHIKSKYNNKARLSLVDAVNDDEVIVKMHDQTKSIRIAEFVKLRSRDVFVCLK